MMQQAYEIVFIIVKWTIKINNYEKAQNRNVLQRKISQIANTWKDNKENGQRAMLVALK
jgi:hypothetical protein